MARHDRHLAISYADDNPVVELQDAEGREMSLDLSAIDALDAANEAVEASEHTFVLREYLVANYTHLHRRLRHHLGCAEQASECLHDAWLRLGESTVCPTLQSPEAYVYRVAINLAIDRLRSRRAWQYTSDADFKLDYLPDPSPGPDCIVEVRSDIAAVERAMQRLPRRHRAVLVALRIEEMTRQQVASRYDMSLRSVDTALRQALDHCEKTIGQPVQGGVSTTRRALRQPQVRA